MEASYKKLRDGSWGIRTMNGIPGEGDEIDVTTKSGEVKQETIAKVIWSGKNDDDSEASICEIVKRDRDGNVIAKPKQQQAAGGGKQQGGGAKPKCECCRTTQAEKYYCEECVRTGGALRHADGQGDGGEGDDIPF